MSFSELHQADFQRLQQVQLVAQSAHFLNFVVDDVPLIISAQDQYTMRLKLGQSAAADYHLLQAVPSQFSLQLTEVDEGWQIDCGSMRLELFKAPLRLRLSRDGKVVLHSITDQHFKGRTRLPAFGCSVGKNTSAPAMLWCAAFALASDTAVYGLGDRKSVV